MDLDRQSICRRLAVEITSDLASWNRIPKPFNHGGTHISTRKFTLNSHQDLISLAPEYKGKTIAFHVLLAPYKRLMYSILHKKTMIRTSLCYPIMQTGTKHIQVNQAN